MIFKILIIDKSKGVDSSVFFDATTEAQVVNSVLYKAFKSKQCDIKIAYASNEHSDLLPSLIKLREGAKDLAKTIVDYSPDLIICLGNIAKTNLCNNILSGFEFSSNQINKVWGYDLITLPHPKECIEGLGGFSIYAQKAYEILKKEGILCI